MAKGSKYNARRASWHGRSYASTAERDYRRVLEVEEATGRVSDVQEQPVVELFPGHTYRPDFSLVPYGESRVWVDVKGCSTERFELNVRLWRRYGPGRLVVVAKTRGLGFVTQRVVDSLGLVAP